MISYINTIEEGHPFYLIGTNMGNDYTLNHELALYSVNREYKWVVDQLLNNLQVAILEKCRSCLRTHNYHERTIDDELSSIIVDV